MVNIKADSKFYTSCLPKTLNDRADIGSKI